MAMACDICGKKRMAGHKVSHSNIKTRKFQRPNLQKVRVVVGGGHRRLRICTRCIRSGRVLKVA